MTDKVALLLEDDGLIAFDVGQTLMDAGYFVVTLGSRASALQWLTDNDPPTVALIDLNLADGPGHSVAIDLNERGVPFAVHTGAMQLMMPQDEPFSAGVFMAKPSATNELLSAVDRALQSPPKTPPVAAR